MLEVRMSGHPWVQEFAGAVTVCDPDGIILEMNEKAARSFQDQGGRALIGTNMLDCHPEPARTKTRELLDSRRTNVYTIEKRGQKKLVYQAPWHQDGEYRGFIELVLEIPAEMPHFVRES
jgi:transcriptional regulator with PAS, ATPase and Fis domain